MEARPAPSPAPQWTGFRAALLGVHGPGDSSGARLPMSLPCKPRPHAALLPSEGQVGAARRT